MRSFERSVFVAAVIACWSTCWSTGASAQQKVQGYNADRLTLSAPGAGWFVMDSLDTRDGLGGVMALTTGYAHAPLVVRATDGSQRLPVVDDQAIANFAFAGTYRRFRLYLDIRMPLVTSGQGGTIGGTKIVAPNVTVPGNPDSLGDARIGFDARILGNPRDAFRLGAGAQLFIPNGLRSDYLTDGTYRAMFRALFAGDVSCLTYAGHLGVHVRPLDDPSAPWTPHGSELIFGVAAGPRVLVGSGLHHALVVGPEIYGATAFSSFFSGPSTALEALVSTRLEGVGEGPQLRLKVGAGAGINPYFGEPQWRVVFGVEVFDQSASR